MKEATELITKINNYACSVAIKDSLINIDGKVIEEKYVTENGNYIIFTTDDCPYEETLHITLLNNNLQLLDQVTLFNIYTEGSLTINEISSNKIRFTFFKDHPMELQYLPNGKRFFHLKSYIKYSKFFWRKRFIKIAETNNT